MSSTKVASKRRKKFAKKRNSLWDTVTCQGADAGNQVGLLEECASLGYGGVILDHEIGVGQLLSIRSRSKRESAASKLSSSSSSETSSLSDSLVSSFERSVLEALDIRRDDLELMRSVLDDRDKFPQRIEVRHRITVDTSSRGRGRISAMDVSSQMPQLLAELRSVQLLDCICVSVSDPFTLLKACASQWPLDAIGLDQMTDALHLTTNVKSALRMAKRSDKLFAVSLRTLVSHSSVTALIESPLRCLHAIVGTIGASNLIVNSAATRKLQLRRPSDLASLSTVFGIDSKQKRGDTISANVCRMLDAALQRKTHRGICVLPSAKLESLGTGKEMKRVLSDATIVDDFLAVESESE